MTIGFQADDSLKDYTGDEHNYRGGHSGRGGRGGRGQVNNALIVDGTVTDINLEATVEAVGAALSVTRLATKHPGETLSSHKISAMFLTISTDDMLYL